MKITSQEEYGLRCLLRLARAGRDRPLTIPEIAAGGGVSNPHPAKPPRTPRPGGLIWSGGGRTGGSRLAAAPADVGLGSVLRVLGEPLFDDTNYCMRHAGTESDGGCVHRNGCSLRGLWRSLEQWMRGALDRITLADLLQGEGRIPELLRPPLSDALAETPAPIHLTRPPAP